MDMILSLLQWLVPVLGTAIVWLTNRTLRNSRTVKEVHDTYKAMYEDQRQTLITLQNENGKLYRDFARLERLVSRAAVCRHWPACPVRTELQNLRTDYGERVYRQPQRQPPIRSPGVEDDADTALTDEPGTPDARPP